MRITTRTKYALISLSEFKNTKSVITTREISEKYCISKKYLERILKKLETDDILKGKRGAKGGYKLNKEFSDISLKDIIFNLEKELDIVSCKDKDFCCPKIDDCEISYVWEILNKKIYDYLESIKLDKLFQKEKVNESKS